MAFYITLEKIFENSLEVSYRYYSDGEHGEYILNKETYDIKLIKPIESDEYGHILKRAVMKIIRIIQAGEECPEKTVWAS